MDDIAIESTQLHWPRAYAALAVIIGAIAMAVVYTLSYQP